MIGFSGGLVGDLSRVGRLTCVSQTGLFWGTGLFWELLRIVYEHSEKVEDFSLQGVEFRTNQNTRWQRRWC